MKKIFVAALLSACALTAVEAQETNDYVFTPVKELKITPVQNQSRTGTCWCFSTLGFIESELIRMGKGEHNLSEMFVVNHTYRDKAEKYVRMHGTMEFAEGGAFDDVLYAIKHYGIVPEAVMDGKEYGEDIHVHSELVGILRGYVDAVIKNRNGKLSPVWQDGFNAVVDTYLGKLPEKFTYNGKEYTPQSYAKELGLNMDDYVSLTSFSHEPFYKAFPIEVPDNWRWSASYNLPIDELMQVFDNAINTGYTIAWASDVSEIGFTRNGIGVAPDVEAIETSGSDQDKWVGLSAAEKNAELRKMVEKPGVKEVTVTQEMRQKAYDNYQTTDDHGMQIFGIAKDQTGKKFYMVKNSWGTDSKYNGVWYVSETFAKYKTMDIIVHKDALPKAIRTKLGI
ncbi:aminopeptidase C [Parabacteroides sp. PFB2-12]|uniref:aminopeptidase C n=1 Tax=unclassified Parabacteroides TaxID=2649774 RepID=UPI00247644AB|nr:MULTISPECIES: C1 family peptidase [unclassified Parabacteroides]MDH6342294.1 aminopeptidase C [Parabacteroides sp. PM6-13]MDH6390637.1 aminopeptidase C [Parabacteroides sp. PFB2-12]MDL2309759.1 aminopeptidase [Parabacteroides sp. OttesenSCG-928-B22]